MADPMDITNPSLQEVGEGTLGAFSQDVPHEDIPLADSPDGNDWGEETLPPNGAAHPGEETEMSPVEKVLHEEISAGEDPYADPAAWAELQTLYPEADPADPVLMALVDGTTKPTLRQLYEAIHFEKLASARETEAGERGRMSVEAQVEERIQAAVKAAMESAVSGAIETAMASAVNAAVTQAVCEHEERLLEHIRARGHRPSENGTSGEGGIYMHPAVERLTRHERAVLARRAENGETVYL